MLITEEQDIFLHQRGERMGLSKAALIRMLITKAMDEQEVDDA